MTQTLQQYCNNNRLTAKKFHAKLESIGLHITEHTASSWVSGRTKPNKQYWGAVYKATEGLVDIQGTPSIKSTEAVLLEMQKELARDLLRLETKIDKLMEKIL